jgi:hypothetical protein
MGAILVLEVASAEYLEGYKIRLRFNNGRTGVVDLKDSLWGPMFEPLKDVSVFKRFTVSEVVHTIFWENDADFAPEFLYDKMVEQLRAAGAIASPR